MTKFKIKLFNCFIILILSVTVSTRASIIIPTNKVLTSNSSNSEPSHLLYIKEDQGLVQVSLPNYKIGAGFYYAEKALAMDYHYTRNLLFWTTKSGEIYSCSRSELGRNARVTEVTLVYKDSRWYPLSLAVDYLADNLYVLDKKTNALYVVSLSTKRRLLLNIGARQFKPEHVEVDPEKGLIFLSDTSHYGYERSGVKGHILRMKLDGSEPKIIDPVSSRNIGMFTLDRVNKRILLSLRKQKKIVSLNYNGRLLNTVLEGQNGTTYMSVTRNTLYWVNNHYYRTSGGSAFLDLSAYKCDYNPATGCLASSIRKLHDGPTGSYLESVLAIDKDLPQTNLKHPACPEDQSLLLPHQIRLGCDTIRCEIGWKKSSGANESCVPANDEFLIYGDETIRGVCLATNAQEQRSCQPFAPVVLNFLEKTTIARLGFDYDASSRDMYHGSWRRLFSVNIETDATKFLQYQDATYFGPMTIDWLTKNVFYTEIHPRGRVSFFLLKVMSARRPDDEKWTWASSSRLWEFPSIYHLSVHPYRGYLFVAGRDNGKNVMMRLEADGKNPKILPALNNTAYFSIDYLGDRLYTLNANRSSILSSDLDGRNIRTLVPFVNCLNDIKGMLYHDGVLYVQTSYDVRRFDSESGRPLEQLDLFPYNLEMNVGMRVHSERVFKRSNETNPCAKDNGGCENFCFALPGKNRGEPLRKICKCFEGINCETKA